MTLKTVLRTIEHYKLLPTNQTLIIGVSGGTDSLALCHIMVQLREKLRIQIHVATLDHGIRGKESESDVQFVKQIADQWNIPYTAGYTDVPHLSKQENIGIEEAARLARYRFFADVAQAQSASYVVVAHHADDQAETILMHIVRGSGLKGLRGMEFSAPMPFQPHITLVRPLLHISRRDLEQYCRENKLLPRQDVTNDDINYQRNFIRHEIMPRLQQINPNVVSSFSRLSDIAEVEDDYVTRQFEKMVMVNVKRDDRRWSLEFDIFQSLHDALRRRFLLEAYNQLTESNVALDMNHVNQAIRWVGQAQVGTAIDLGQGIRIRLGYVNIFVEHNSAPVASEAYRLIPNDTNIVLSVPSELTYEGIKLALSFDKPKDDKSALLIPLPQNLSISLRTRRAGERFRPQGMDGRSKKIKDWMIDRKIPQQLRDQIPLIVANEDIIAIGLRDTWHLADLSQYIVKLNHIMYLTLGQLNS